MADDAAFAAAPTEAAAAHHTTNAATHNDINRSRHPSKSEAEIKTSQRAGTVTPSGLSHHKLERRSLDLDDYFVCTLLTSTHPPPNSRHGIIMARNS